MPDKDRDKEKENQQSEQQERKEKLRRNLVKQREELLAEAKKEMKNYLSGENRQLVETALDDGDFSVVDLSEDLNLRRLNAHRDTLMKIDESLRKLNEGTYGFCEECGDEIAAGRLKVLPFAIYCRDCQENIEEREQLERERGEHF